MTDKDFKSLVANRVEVCDRIMGIKAEEYATQDRLWNFKRAAAIMGHTVPMAVLGMLNKHLVSVLDMAAGIRSFDQKTLDEKFSDLHNYLYLLEAALKEHQEQAQARDMLNTRVMAAMDKMKERKDPGARTDTAPQQQNRNAPQQQNQNAFHNRIVD